MADLTSSSHYYNHTEYAAWNSCLDNAGKRLITRIADIPHQRTYVPTATRRVWHIFSLINSQKQSLEPVGVSYQSPVHQCYCLAAQVPGYLTGRTPSSGSRLTSARLTACTQSPRKGEPTGSNGWRGTLSAAVRTVSSGPTSATGTGRPIVTRIRRSGVC